MPGLTLLLQAPKIITSYQLFKLRTILTRKPSHIKITYLTTKCIYIYIYIYIYVCVCVFPRNWRQVATLVTYVDWSPVPTGAQLTAVVANLWAAIYRTKCIFMPWLWQIHSSSEHPSHLSLSPAPYMATPFTAQLLPNSFQMLRLP
jgi:hypothetical protein